MAQALNKLLICGKDGALVKPVSGHEFVQHPSDQELLPGVAERIAEYAADGWKMVIVSNQGGCDTQTCLPLDFPIGSYYVEPEDPANYPVRVIRKTNSEHGVTLHTATPRRNGKDYLWFDHYCPIHYQHKTLDDAIAEMKYVCGLVGITHALFCPDLEGWQCMSLVQNRLSKNKDWSIINQAWFLPRHRFGGSYRKPDPGMINLLVMIHQPEQVLMIGDRPEDQQAAANAGVEFMWAHEWRLEI